MQAGVDNVAKMTLIILNGLFSKVPQKCFSPSEQLETPAISFFQLLI